MRYLKLYTLLLLPLLFAACKDTCDSKPTFFDKIKDKRVHNRIFNTDTAVCLNTTPGYKFYEYYLTYSPSELGSIEFYGDIICQSNSIYFSDKYNEKPILLFPFKQIGYKDSVNYNVDITRDSIVTFKYQITVDDVFFDPFYNDTIYKITRDRNVIFAKVFKVKDVFFLGKHSGLVGHVIPIWSPSDTIIDDKNYKTRILNLVGKIYPEKYNYDPRPVLIL